MESTNPVPPIQAPAMRPSPFRSPAGGIWADLYMIAEPGAVAQARRFAAAYLRRRRLTALAETVTLAASELVTNAVRHTGTPPSPLIEPDDLDQAIVALRIRLTPAGLFVEVWDRDPRPPILTHADALDEGGRGLALVAALARMWDYYPCAAATAGKVVWAEIPIAPVTS
jgi:anti-sigma regulatory factor (Ser/Thr protein kinase)